MIKREDFSLYINFKHTKIFKFSYQLYYPTNLKGATGFVDKNTAGDNTPKRIINRRKMGARPVIISSWEVLMLVFIEKFIEPTMKQSCMFATQCE